MKAYQTKANALYLAISNISKDMWHLAYSEDGMIHIFISNSDLFYVRLSQVASRKGLRYRVLRNSSKITKLVLMRMQLVSNLLDSLASPVLGHRLPYPINGYIDNTLALFSISQSRSTRVLPIHT
jgi:hypothetical protein